MKKLYNLTKGKIHPSPPPSTTPDHHLSFLPVSIATLAAALAPEDQEVLAYLLSTTASFSKAGNPTYNSVGGASSGGDHSPQFNCNCFRCYTSFWVRWDASPNQKAIHDIIDAYEDGLFHMEHRKSDDENGDGISEKGPVRKLVSFIGGRVWGVWGI